MIFNFFVGWLSNLKNQNETPVYVALCQIQLYVEGMRYLASYVGQGEYGKVSASEREVMSMWHQSRQKLEAVNRCFVFFRLKKRVLHPNLAWLVGTLM